MPLDDMDGGSTYLQKILTNKLQITPEIFKGIEGQWNDWATLFRANVLSISEDLADAMEAVESKEGVVTRDSLPESLRDVAWNLNAQLRAALVAYTRDKAQRIIFGVSDRKNGLECWRQLTNHYCKGGMSRGYGLMQIILSYDFSGDDFMDRLLQWEQIVQEYDKAPGCW
jgi:hypothetical protein